MQTTEDLGTLERKIFKTLFADGFIDIGFGLWMVSWSILILAGNAGFGGVLPALLLPVWYRLRERFTEPRLGAVRFRSRAKSARLAWVIGGLTFVLLIGIGLAMTRGSLPRGFEDAVSAQSHMLLGGTLAFLMVLLAAVFRVGRLLAYAALLIALFASGSMIQLHFPYSMAAAGAIILLSGLVVLLSFVRSHPRAEAVNEL